MHEVGFLKHRWYCSPVLSLGPYKIVGVLVSKFVVAAPAKGKIRAPIKLHLSFI